ncbi:MAG: glycine cleavage system protein R [Gammaproteobacteria bacterium]|nr:glycine cleavage system protein R [Gammaproteobacteria bacterium]
MTKQNYLVLSAIGSDRPGLVDQLTRAIQESNGNILDSRMTVLGGEFAILMLIEGGWDTIARLEETLPTLQESMGLTILTRRTETKPATEPVLPYMVSVVALDHPGIVNQLSSFFSNRQINIQSLETDSYHAAHTGTPMFSVNMNVQIPAEHSIVQLRTEFFEFCDGLNLDAILEPLKGN